MADATNVLHEFACRCAEDALELIDNPDPRGMAAIQEERDWLARRSIELALIAGSDKNLAEARAMAMTAALTAVRFASRAASRDEAMTVARAEAMTKAQAAQNRRLTAMVSHLLRGAT
jgi:hypothetical protein